MKLIVHGYECMTVADLIEKLRQFPPDAPIVYGLHSDYAALRPEEVKLHTKEGKTMVRRQTGVQEVYPNEQWGDEKPKFITVVEFPGN